MVAESFFSTVAKVSATIIGFALAVFTVYFQINRQSRLNQTEEAIKLVEEFADEYHDVLDRTRSLILSEVGPDLDTDYQYRWVNNTPEELREAIQDDSAVKAPETTYVYSLLAGIQHLCRNTGETRIAAGEAPSEQVFEKLSELIQALVDYFHPYEGGQEWVGFYREVSGDANGYESPIPVSRFDADILSGGESEYHFDSLFHWINTRDKHAMRPYEHFDVNGLGIASLYLLSRSMLGNYKDINRELRGTLINYNPRDELAGLIHKPASVAIISFGLIIPLAMLIETPTLSPTLATYLPIVRLIELIQIISIPILILSFYYQFLSIYTEVVDINKPQH